MSPWKHESDPLTIRRIGKLGEELAELSKVVCRIQIQGISGIDPKTGKSNKEALTEEIADVIAQCELSISQLSLRGSIIADRIEVKKQRMEEWELALRNEVQS